jgi:glycine betaine/proline transport system substrate-binding protein
MTINANASDSMVPLGNKKIVMVKAPWATLSLVTSVSKYLLEQMGYQVETPLLSTGPAWEALANKSADIFSAGFLPGQYAHFKKYHQKVDLLAHSYLPVLPGLMAPSYLPIDSIEDLKDPEVKKKLNGKILGIDPGSGVWLTTEKVLKAYDLDYTLVPGSSATIFAVMQKGAKDKEWNVGMGWKPDVIWGKLNMKFLDDPKRIYPHNTDFHIVRNDFREEFPRASIFFSRLTMHPDNMAKYLGPIAEGEDPEMVAKQFISDYPEEVYFWVYDLIDDYPVPESLK